MKKRKNPKRTKKPCVDLLPTVTTILIVIQARTILVIGETVLIRNSIKKNIAKMIIHPVKRNIGKENDGPGHVLVRHIKETVEANPLVDRTVTKLRYNPY